MICEGANKKLLIDGLLRFKTKREKIPPLAESGQL
jgi:hypothetical protein